MKTIQRMYAHLNWANKLILQVLEDEGKDHARAIELFTHILRAERIWLSRMRGEDSTQIPLWLGDDVTVCSQLVNENEAGFEAYLASMTSEELEQVISYSSQAGVPFQTSIGDILTHVALHGQYHRGQINSLLRASGVEPARIDFILFAR
jgi:uncharacterized damage-inducible protein DinB